MAAKKYSELSEEEKEVVRQYHRDWRAKNPQKSNDYINGWKKNKYESDPEWRQARLDSAKSWRLENPEKAKQSSLSWQHRNPERVKEINRMHARNSPTKRQRDFLWQKNNPEKVKFNNKKHYLFKKIKEKGMTDKLKAQLLELLGDGYAIIPLTSLNRVEVIDKEGRSYVNWSDNNKVSVQTQDDNKTLKIFIQDKE